MDVEFGEWEMLQSNQASESESLTPAGSAESTAGLDEIGGVIQPNYFGIDSQIRHMNGSEVEEDSEESDNPSWIDPTSENIKTPGAGEFWLDSGSEPEAKSEFDGSFEEEIATETVEESESNPITSAGQNEGILQGNEEKIQVVEQRSNDAGGGGGGDQKRRSIVWWKVPIQLVKYCAFRVSTPVWTISVAAAVMAFLIVGRRLYKMKKKAKAALQLKVTVDDKNISQFTSRAARLNEAFSIVKRVPVIRPQLPPAGVTLWPVMR
ncbi:hypothetical protein FXO38_08719 [Capsicum annuum]|uniref:uncharacterized protein LOC107868420 n=1 Tax=Capsicum annuum TaxID=4072 RepID=UPI001FB07D35|nr:uncharacterized protein LOC107868420 [Capsicum annuum]XP_047249722.1 uncharacterized protein LOC107868420 [Capsicum annuum]KAF3667216.1 hypothetical protein FXO38_08719 [Capsicum annuum]